MKDGELGDPERWDDGVVIPGGLGVAAVAAGGLDLGVDDGVDLTDSSSSDFSSATPSEVHV